MRSVNFSNDNLAVQWQYVKRNLGEFGIQADKIKLIQYGLSGSLFQDIQKTMSDKIRFAFIGTILPAKEIDILIVPSIWHENNPLVIQEAFLSKTPVIASNIGGIPELVIDGVNGLLFEPQDANDLREKIQHIIDEPNILEKFKENIPEVKNIEDNIREIEKLYNSLLDNNCS